MASKGEIESMTMPALFKLAAKKKGDKIALRVEWPIPPLDKDGKWPKPLPPAEWRTWTYKQYYEESCSAAQGLIALGFAQHDACTIWGFNSPWWFMAQQAAMLAGGKAAGIYPSDTPEQVRYKTDHSNASFAVVQSKKMADTFGTLVEGLPYVKYVVVWDEAGVKDLSFTRKDGSKLTMITWTELLAAGNKAGSKMLEERAALIKPSHCCTLIYTSGTTGQPKACMLTHDNLLFESRVVTEGCLPNLGNDANDDERVLSYLPLSHVAGLMMDIIAQVTLGAFQEGSCIVNFSRPYDLKVGSLVERMKDVKPTLFLGVPRVWEKIMEKMKSVGSKTTGFKRIIADWAKKQSLRYEVNKQVGGNGHRPTMYNLADKLVLSKVKEALGLGECKFGFTGAAPISRETLEFFGSVGININEVYGMSECTGSTTFSTDEEHQWGSVGWPMPGMEVRILRMNEAKGKYEPVSRTTDLFNPGEEFQGEICFRGRHIMLGYMANRRLGSEHEAEIEQKNREAIDDDGWCHSGDKGCMSVAGMVRVTGRYKELIKGSGGENISPVPIEDAIKLLCDGISNVQMIGDKRKFNVALVTLVAKGASGESKGTNQLEGAALEVDPKCTTIEQAAQSSVWIKLISDTINKVNEDGSVVPSPAARIQKFTILPHDFSVDGGELTATLKLKRSVSEATYADVIERMYASEKMYTPYKA